MRRTRAAILISGRGSNMAALIEASRRPECPYAIGLVVSNRPDAAGLTLAREAGIEAIAIDHRSFDKDRLDHEQALNQALLAVGTEVVALAGYMRILTPFLVREWQGRMLNIHPSLLPAYKGTHTHEKVLAAGDTEHGCSVHLVTDGVDEGEVLAQARVPVIPGDTAETLAQRVLHAENQLYPRALADFVRDYQARSTR